MEERKNKAVTEDALAGLQETQGERVLKALKRVYDKIRLLEKDRIAAKESVESLGTQTDHPSTSDFYRRLAKAEARCKLLEEQLIHVREIIADAPLTASKDFIILQDKEIFKKKSLADSSFKSEKIKASFVKKTSEDLSSHNTLELPFWHRKLDDSKNGNGKGKDQGNLPLSPQLPRVRKSNQREPKYSNEQTVEHYHINMNKMPFLSAASTGKSHSLSANIQRLYSMIKYCNPALCSAAHVGHQRHRSLSADRYTSQKGRGREIHGISKWNSASDITSLHRQSRPEQRENHSSIKAIDLYQPSQLKTRRAFETEHRNKCTCGGPAKVCVRTRLKCNSKGGEQKVLEVKMTTPTSPGLTRKHKRGGNTGYMTASSQQRKRKQLLRDLKNLHHYLQQDIA